MQQRCEQCRFWEQDTALCDTGFCIRHAPQPICVQDCMTYREVVFPVMPAKGRCGEWQPQPTPQQRGDAEEHLRGLLREFLDAARQDEITGGRLALLVEKVEEVLEA